MKLAVLSLVGIFVLLGCSKQDIPESYPQLIGDYDWSYTIVSDTNAIVKQNSEHLFGVRIRKNGRMELYEDGELIRKGIVYSVNESDGILYILYQEHNTHIEFELDASENSLSSPQFPVKAYKNVFVRL